MKTKLITLMRSDFRNISSDECFDTILELLGVRVKYEPQYDEVEIIVENFIAIQADNTNSED